MTAQDLKDAILQLAVQGKLVPQDPADEPTSELLKRIQAEKSQLAKEGKRKKETPIQPISVDESPFDIPESWVWVRLGECSSYAQKKKKADKNTIAPDTWSLDLEDIEKGTGRIVRKCLFRDRNISGERVMFQKGQILFSKLRPYLKKVLVAPNDGVCSSEIIPFSVYAGINAQYMAYVLTTPHIDFVINSVTYGTKMPRVGTDTMTNLLIPLPPLAEQARIVAKIEELLPLVAEYAETEQKLSTLNAEFPDMLRQSILQQGIQGRLSERDPTDEPANQLIKRIRHSKDALLRAGKIKKEKSLPPISDKEKPFEIPDTWEWVRLSDICNISDGTHQTPRYVENGVPFISAQNVKPYRFIPEVHRDVSREDYLEYNKVIAPAKGDILMTRVGAGIGEAAIIDQDFEFSIYVSLALIKRYGNELNMEYLLHVLNSPQGRSLAAKKTLGKGASQGNLNLVFIREFVVPIPPLAEQQRIVERVEELLAVCGQLK